MNATQTWKIQQIISAQPGWKAIYCQRSNNNEVRISNRVIICWALVETVGTDAPPRTEVRGVVQDANRLIVVGNSTVADTMTNGDATENQYFLGYNDPDAHKESNYWIDQAHARLKIEHSNTAEQRKC